VRSHDIDRQDFEQSAVADVRRAVGTYPDDADLQQLVSDLCRVSPRFAELWRRRLVHARSSGRKTIVHPEVGAIELDCDVLTADGTDIRLVVYTADPSSPDADKLELVRVLGLQMLGTRDG
jgi:hypothetical protein